ncbi:MAG TPA: cysteine--tRNA ligase, partial [Vicinamibacteria bacterium]|nr:cysteine--tRNA ligase [Vicinamibacteria bacterium]
MNLHNTLTGRVEALAPAQPPELRMYVCGPTVYGRAHIGNFRSFLATDLLRRALRYKGWRVKEVMNVTDVDDKIIRLASQGGTDLRRFTAEHIRSFDEDRTTLRMEQPELLPRATDHIPDMIGLVQRLIDRGHTYAADGSVYFKIATFPEYGRLSRLDVAGIRSGARVDTDKYDKEDARDFVVWKAKQDEPEWAQWDAPFGRGRPGWHLECSAMSMKYLGETFDLHCGGVDLIFPHHENEIAQSTCATGKPFVRHWMHVTHLLVDNETMSKSKGNFYTIPDLLERGHRPDAIRYLLSAAQYRKPLNFTWEGLHQAATSIDKVHGFVRRLDEVDRDGPALPAVEEAV